MAFGRLLNGKFGHFCNLFWPYTFLKSRIYRIPYYQKYVLLLNLVLFGPRIRFHHEFCRFHESKPSKIGTFIWTQSFKTKIFLKSISFKRHLPKRLKLPPNYLLRPKWNLKGPLSIHPISLHSLLLQTSAQLYHLQFYIDSHDLSSLNFDSFQGVLHFSSRSQRNSQKAISVLARTFPP